MVELQRTVKRAVGDDFTVQFSSVAQLCPTLCDPMDCNQASLYITNSWSLLKLMSIESVMPSNHLILCCPRLFPPSIFPIIKIFSNESVLHIRWPKYLSFSVNISPSNEYSGLIFFRIDWLDLLAVQGTLQESSSTRQFKSINYSTPNFLYSPTLTIHTNIKSVYCTLETNVTCQLYYNEMENKKI